ncbi:type II toxin-antitoxin system PemK/MazF family toxin [Pedobacter changchengzhani]|nr:type II toxin-antitoxin system PemK/MazF family toxin [Pedobacter changchengzhani]
MVIKQFEVWLIELDPTKGSEVKKARPCLVISPNVINNHLATISVIPLTSTIKSYPTRVDCIFKERNGQLMVEQMRSLDKVRFIKKLGVMDKDYCKLVCDLLVETYRWRP